MTLKTNSTKTTNSKTHGNKTSHNIAGSASVGKTKAAAASKYAGELYGETVLLCPRCAVRMKKLKNGDTIIDVCDSCEGMWLDKGEVQKLAARHARTHT